MTYDAVLVARRGLGPAELQLAVPAFMRAVRWAVFAEKFGADLTEIRAAVATDPPARLEGAALTEFIANRNSLRRSLKVMETLLYPEDEDG